jgi:elongation factor P hydroxylase
LGRWIGREDLAAVFFWRVAGDSLFVAQGYGGVDAHGAAGWEVAGQERDGAEQQSYCGEGDGVGGLHAV